MDEVRYGVIGTGMMGLEHINNVNAIDGARVVRVFHRGSHRVVFGKLRHVLCVSFATGARQGAGNGYCG